MWLCVGMASVGLVVGSLVAFTSVHLAERLFLAFFALIGGSVAALFHKIPPRDRSLAGATLSAISLGSLVGIYSGIVVRQYQWLTPPAQRTWANARPCPAATVATLQTSDTQRPPAYLDDMAEDAIKGVLVDFEHHRYTLAEAVLRIKEAVPRPSATPEDGNHKMPQSNP